ncbi:MAG: hypothetical protein IJJ33_04620 [Victivallales bacterium]|nr:hypothetical protein [Victivallales bacterium]
MGSLETRAEQFSALVEGQAMDESGVVRFVLPLPGLEDCAPPPSPYPGVSSADYFPYEDSGMATGAYLAAQSLCHLLTGNQTALRRARRAYHGLRHIYRLGAESVWPGFFPKPFRGGGCRTCSRDQYIFAMSGMREYAPLASASERREISEMLSEMAGHWRRIRHCPPLGAPGTPCQLHDYIAGVFLGIQAAPCGDHRDPAAAECFLRLLAAAHLEETLCDTLRAKFRRGERYDGAQYFRQNENPLMMKALTIRQIWEAFPQHRSLCLKAMRNYVRDDLFLELSPMDGLNYYIMRYVPETDSLCLAPPGRISSLAASECFPFLTWGGDRRRAGSTQSAFAAIVASRLLGEPALAVRARAVLEQLTLDKFRGMSCSSEQDIPPGCEYMSHLLYCNYICFWLWDYYLLADDRP